MLKEPPMKIRARLVHKFTYEFTLGSALLFDDLRRIGIDNCDKRFYARSQMR